MKNAVILFLIINSAFFAQSNQIDSFTKLLELLKNGNEIRAIIDYSKCELIIDSQKVESPKAIGGMNFNTFEFFDVMSVHNPKAFISVSENVLIFHPRYGYVINYAKIRIYSDDNVEILVRYLDPKTYEIKMDETFKTQIDKGNNTEGLKLFIK